MTETDEKVEFLPISEHLRHEPCRGFHGNYVCRRTVTEAAHVPGTGIRLPCCGSAECRSIVTVKALVMYRQLTNKNLRYMSKVQYFGKEYLFK
jgi:hypothetical protein